MKKTFHLMLAAALAGGLSMGCQESEARADDQEQDQQQQQQRERREEAQRQQQRREAEAERKVEQPAGPQRMQLRGEALFRAFDEDRNDRITREEFAEGFDDTFRGFDRDGDGALDANEVSRALFSAWNRDDDQHLTETELTQAVDDWFRPGVTRVVFTEIDANNDQRVSQQELSQALRRSNIHRVFDDDNNNRVERREIGSVVFALWDRDGDREVSQEEWRWD